MELGSSFGSGLPEKLSDFAFAFNDVNFSDRVLRIEILLDVPGPRPGFDDSLTDWARNRKRRRDDHRNALELTVQREEQIMSCNIPDMEDGVTYGNVEEAVTMIEEPPVNAALTMNNQPNMTSNEDTQEVNETVSGMDYSAIVVKTIHISSPILAAKSPFFYKLFSNGMRESEQRHVTLRIHASEEAALMDLLNFMYSNSLTRTTPSALLDVLMAADKYEVVSCMRYCSRLLLNLPMTCESALLYLDLPSTVLMADTVQPLTDAAKRFLAESFKDMHKFQEEALSLPLSGIEAILASDDLQVPSEDSIIDFVLKWAQLHYPKLEERREILTTRLSRLIRFPFISCRKLRKILTCNDFDPELASKVVVDALFFKVEALHRQRSLIADGNVSLRRYAERAYRYRCAKVVEFELPRQHCIVYLDLKRDECTNLFPSGRIYSQAFYLGGQGFFLSAHCNMDQQGTFHCFGLFLGMQEKGSDTFIVEYEFASRTKPSEEFVIKYKGSYNFTGGKAVGFRSLFGVPWTTFIAEDSPFFINGILHLRAELTVKPRI